MPGRIVGREEQRIVEHRDRAPLCVGREVRLEPLLLHRAGGVAHRRGVVQYDDVPIRTNVEAVVVLRRVAHTRLEVVVERAGPRDIVLVVPDDRTRPRLVTSPRGRVAVGVVRRAPARIHVVAEDKDLAGQAIEDLGGLIVDGAAARRDVARAREDLNGGRIERFHDDIIRPRGAVLVGDREPCGVLSGRGVDVTRRDRAQRVHTPAARGAVAPRDRIRPRAGLTHEVAERGGFHPRHQLVQPHPPASQSRSG